MTVTGDKWTGTVLNVTSQRWRSDSEVSRSVWWHYMVIIQPDAGVSADSNTGFMYLSDGANDRALNANSVEMSMVGTMAVQTGVVAAVLFDIPNQPIVFTGSSDEKSEDRLIAHTWMDFVNDKSRPDRIAYFAMAKAGVRGMTVAQQAFQKYFRVNVEQFYLSGASKRAATVWLITAYESYKASVSRTKTRLLGSAPLVFDALNFAKSVPRMYEMLNGWSFAFRPYQEEGVTAIIGTPDMEALGTQIDASGQLYFKDVARQDVLVVNSSGDEFFMLDNDSQWLHLFMGTGPTDPLSRVSNMRRAMIPNAEHMLFSNLEDVMRSITGHFNALRNASVAYTSWSLADGVLTMVSDIQPRSAELLSATTIASDPNRRDFRLLKANVPGGCLSPAFPIDDKCANPVLWAKTPLTVDYNSDSKLYEAKAQLVEPASGWTGYFIRLHFFDGQTYTTQVKIVPDTMPFAPCQGEQC